EPAEDAEDAAVIGGVSRVRLGLAGGDVSLDVGSVLDPQLRQEGGVLHRRPAGGGGRSPRPRRTRPRDRGSRGRRRCRRRGRQPRGDLLLLLLGILLARNLLALALGRASFFHFHELISAAGR